MPSAPETRARLLAAARRAFADLGYARARVEDVGARLVEVLGGLSDLYDRDADLIALWTEASTQDPELGRLLDEVRRQFVARIARNIERAAAQGLTRPVDPWTAATALAAM